MNLGAAIHRCFDAEPSRLFAVRDLFERVQKDCELTPFQLRPDPQ